MKCPVCDSEMKRDWEKNIEVDVCLEHGLWLDKGELERIIARTSSSSSSNVYERERVESQKIDQARWEGIVFGIWSLFFKK